MERHHPPEEQACHTDHAPAAAAAPAPGARTGAVTESVKAQDPAYSVSDQHHLDERVAPSGGADRRWRAHGKLPGTSQLLTCPQKPAPSAELRKAA